MQFTSFWNVTPYLCESSTFFWNVGKHLPDHTASHPSKSKRHEWRTLIFFSVARNFWRIWPDYYWSWYILWISWKQHSIMKTDKSLIQSLIYQWHYSPLLDPGLFFSFVIFFTQSVGLLGRGISPSQGRYLYTGQYKRRINAHTDINALSWIRTHDPSVRASEDSSYLRPPGHCDRQFVISSMM
jgi:hypothetical protein